MVKVYVGIDISNLKQAENFYIEALGCKKLRNQGSDIAVLATENCDIYLLEKEPGSKPVVRSETVRDYNRHWTPVHLDFSTENVDVAVNKVLHLGGFLEGGKSGDWGSIAFCVDPFGNGFCLINEIKIT